MCVDYDSSDKATQMFFANTQNKLLYAVTKQTAAEIICERANPNEANMGLTSWKGTKVRKGDIIIAKNYLSKDELDNLNRLVNVFLESAELRVKDNKDSLLTFQGKDILKGNGGISNEKMEQVVRQRYEIFDKKRKEETRIKADLEDEKMLEKTYKALKDR